MSVERSFDEDRRAPFWAGDRRSVLVGWLTLGIVLLAGGAAAARSLLSVRVPHGIPIGLSVRGAGSVLTLIRTMEPYVPSLHHDPTTERFRIALHVQPIGNGEVRMIPLGKGLKAGDLHFAGVLGQEGDFVWCHLDELVGANLKTGRIIRSTDIRAANPELPDLLRDSRQLNFVDRLTFLTPDHRRSYALDPGTLRLAEVPVKLPDSSSYLARKPEHFLSAGVMVSETEWLGLASMEEAKERFEVGSSVKQVVPVDDKKVARHVYRARLGTGYAATVRRVESIEAVPPETLVNGAFVCSGAGKPPIRVSGGCVAIGAADAVPGAKLVVARIDAGGRVVWRRETEIEQHGLEQILPDDRVLAFVGPRPPMPGKLSEPLLVLVDLASGEVKTSTLWR